MSIAEKLTAAGYDLQAISDAKATSSPRSVEVAAFEISGAPVYGLVYRADFRAEEEWGTGDLSRAFSSRAHKKATSRRIFAADLKAGTVDAFGSRGTLGTPGHQADLVTATDKVVVLRTTSPDRDHYAVEDTRRAIDSGLDMIRQYRGYAAGLPSYWRLHDKPYADLKAKAVALGVERPARSKADVIDQIIDCSEPEHTYADAADFHNGRHLVIPRRGAVGVVADALVEAAEAGYLLAGTGGFGPFARGFSLLDERDVPAATRAEAEKNAAWHRQAIVDVDPVKKHLSAQGVTVYAIGSPRDEPFEGETAGPTRYFVNLSPGHLGQFWGWYTIDEMMAEGFAERESAAYRAKKGR